MSIKFFGVAAALAATPLVAQDPLEYRGLAPGASLSDFARSANTLASQDSLTCRTSAHTAALMECGVTITDGETTPTLNAFVIGGRIGLLSVTDSGGAALVARWRDALTAAYGPGVMTRRAMIQWASGERVARLTWRASGDVRWISLTLAHEETLAQIERFLGPRQPTR
jgi:hypothetical protein